MRLRVPALLGLALFGTVTPSGATTVTFRQGDGGYTGTYDTFLSEAAPNGQSGSAAVVRWDGDDPNGTGKDNFTLLRFDGILGSGPGQIPAGAQITNATLTYYVTDTGDPADIHYAVVAWTESETFNTYCVTTGCSSKIGAMVGIAAAPELGFATADVTGSVQAWANGAENLGWIFVPTGPGGAEASSSENASTANRPLLTVVYGEGPPPSNVTRQPYLQLVTSTSATIVWRTESATDSVVHYGTTPGAPDQTASSGTVVTDHVVTFSGLSPATRYYYDVGSSSGMHAGGTSEHYVTTSPAGGTAAPVRAWVIGDSGTGGIQQAAVRDAMLAYTVADRPDMVLHVGDIAYTSGSDDEITDYHFGVYQDVFRNTVSWMTLGNHEGQLTTSGDPGPSLGPYYEAFVLPVAGEAGGVASGTEAYYSFDYGEVHFISLNSTQVNRSASGPMATWLAADLAATNAKWIVAFWHHPPYSRGTHNSDVDVELIEMRENILPILEAGGVDLVLCGHSHAYERSYLIDGTYTTPTPSFVELVAEGHVLDDGDGKPAGDGAYQKPSGITSHEGAVFVVAGHGGASLGGTFGHPVMYIAEAIHGSCILDIDGPTLTLVNVRSTGVVSDSFTIVKGEEVPKVLGTNPPKSNVLGSLALLEVTFTTAVTGVDASDLTVNGSAATAVSASSAQTYVFSGFASPGNGTVTVALAAGGIADASDSSLQFTGSTWTYTIDTSPPRIATVSPPAGSERGALRSITVTFSKPILGLAAADLTVNGQPAATLTGVSGSAGPYEFDGFPEPLGLAEVALAPGAITDVLGQGFAGDAWSYRVRPHLVVNEFLASNDTAATDEFGEHDDYLEVYNPAAVPVDMSGMHLTDSLGFPEQYKIPDGVVIPARGYLVFWCDMQPEQGPLHTNFNLLRTGEAVGLFDTDANGLELVDSYTFLNARTDFSLGRFPDADASFTHMPVTPGAPNTIDCNQPAECAPLDGPCAVGACVASKCVSQPVNEGGACDDGLGCLSPDACQAGTCVGGGSVCGAAEACDLVTGICGVPPCVSDAECDDFDPCTDDVCAGGTCTNVADDSNTCSDGIACTADSCTGGACAGVSACPAGQVCDTSAGVCEGFATASFQEGVSYVGTHDTYLTQAAPGTVQGTLDRFRWDTENPAPNQEIGLLRFDNVFGTGLGQVPPGASISAASVSVVVLVGGPPGGLVQEATVSWSEATDTWNTFGGEPGVQIDEYWATPVYTAPTDPGPRSIDVTASVAAWSSGTRTNRGWIFRPQSPNATVVRSSEGPITSERPKLTVTYGYEPTCAGDAACSDGDACNGVETCVAGKCHAGTPMVCDDGNPCTTDTCGPAAGCGHSAVQVPYEIANLAWDADKQTIRWDSAGPSGPGTVHDVVRGFVPELPVGSGAGETCLATGTQAATHLDATAPALGQAFWYDVRGRNACGIGTYGFETWKGIPVAERTTVICP